MTDMEKHLHEYNKGRQDTLRELAEKFKPSREEPSVDPSNHGDTADLAHWQSENGTYLIIADMLDDLGTPVTAPQFGTEIRDAMQDLLTSQKGIVPHSAERFYSTKMGAFSTVKVNAHINDI